MFLTFFKSELRCSYKMCSHKKIRVYYQYFANLCFFTIFIDQLQETLVDPPSTPKRPRKAVAPRRSPRLNSTGGSSSKKPRKDPKTSSSVVLEGSTIL